jgi:hypothetical protein
MQERSEVKMAKVTVFNFDWPYDPETECARKLAKNRRCKSPTGKV